MKTNKITMTVLLVILNFSTYGMDQRKRKLNEDSAGQKQSKILQHNRPQTRAEKHNPDIDPSNYQSKKLLWFSTLETQTVSQPTTPPPLKRAFGTINSPIKRPRLKEWRKFAPRELESFKALQLKLQTQPLIVMYQPDFLPEAQGLGKKIPLPKLPSQRKRLPAEPIKEKQWVPVTIAKPVVEELDFDPTIDAWDVLDISF